MRKLNIKKVVVLIAIILISIGIGYTISNKNERDKYKKEAEQTEQVEQTEEKNIANNDQEKPRKINTIEISTENQIYAIATLGSFENGKELTVNQYLEVVYNGICNGYIKIGEVKEKNEISEEQVNNIVYSIFGIELNENKSIEGMEYRDGVYKIYPQRLDYIYMIENISRDSAAGSSYIEFDLYKELASGQEQYMGRYTLVTVNNTITGESYIRSFEKIRE